LDACSFRKMFFTWNLTVPANIAAQASGTAAWVHGRVLDALTG
jgi:hypothetical protein